jgi:hypothetical protein
VTCRQIGQEGDEDVRFDANLELVKDRPDRDVALEVLERFLDRNQQQIMAPQLGWVFLDEVGAQQIAAFARAGLPKLVAIEAIAEGGGVCGNLDYRQAPGQAGLIARGAEFHQQLLARQLHRDSCLSRAHSRFNWRRRIARSLATRSRLWAKA